MNEIPHQAHSTVVRDIVHQPLRARRRLRQALGSFIAGSALLGLAVGGPGLGHASGRLAGGLPCGGSRSGVTPKAGGGFSFTPLSVNAAGILVGADGCQVFLVGAQGRQPSAVPSKNPSDDVYEISRSQDFSYLDTELLSHVSMNLLRVPVPVDLWTKNPGMTDGGRSLTYRQFVEEYFGYIESRGLYVEIDKYPSINLASAAADATALTSMAQTFAHDPAVIYDVRNEAPYAYEAKQPLVVLADDQLWLNAVDAGNPNALKVTYMNSITHMEQDPAIYPFYTNRNIVIDFHEYSGFYGTSPDVGVAWKGMVCNEPNKLSDGNGSFYAQSLKPGGHDYVMERFIRSRPHPADVIFNEWGGCEADQSYVSAMQTFVTANNLAGLSYFYSNNWYWHDDYNQQFNGNGTRTAAAYRAILQTSTPPPTPTAIPVPSRAWQPSWTPGPRPTMTPVPPSAHPTLTPALTGTPAPRPTAPLCGPPTAIALGPCTLTRGATG